MKENELFEEAWYALENGDNNELIELAYAPYEEECVIYNAAM